MIHILDVDFKVKELNAGLQNVSVQWTGES